MSRRLTIVVPRFREAPRQVFPLLSGISGQVGIDFAELEVIIVNDGGGAGALDGDFLDLFGIDIKQISLAENAGPGAARQAGLDAAEGGYVMFCDADDTLHNVGVLGALMQQAQRSAADIITTPWLEEIRAPDGQYSYLTHGQENTWMHGKLFRRPFLTENNIRFSPALRVHEDSYFLCIAAAAARSVRHLPVTSYVWKYRPDSITRQNGAAYTYDSFPVFIRACSMAHAQVERIAPEQMEYKVVQFTLYCYFCLHQPGWLAPENARSLRAAESAFAPYHGAFGHHWRAAAPDTIAQLYNQERGKHFAGCVEGETLEAWLARVGEADLRRAAGAPPPPP